MRYRTAALVFLDVLVAGAAGLHVWRQYRIWNVDDTNPPRCSNDYGDEVSCSTSDVAVTLVAAGILCLILFGSLWFQRRRGWI